MINKNIDLINILKYCPKGWKFYSSIHGWIYFEGLNTGDKYPVVISYKNGKLESFGADGRLFLDYAGECVLFPSKDQRDWSKFTAPWYKKEKFDHKTLKTFDRVLCKNGLDMWRCDFFSSYMETYVCQNVCISGSYTYCIPYNDDTKHLVGTKEEAPEFYRYWED